MPTNIRNIAIIAHVDHGKTTLIDNIMKQCGSFRVNQKLDERLMDSGDLEKERGITILAKPTSVKWKDTSINIIDTPGHADFGGEVERVLGMADGVILLIDAAEGPMPQTKFVLGKALMQGLKPIVIINKIDRKDGRPEEVVDEVFDLFVALDANDEQLDFPILYASGRDGWCIKELKETRENLYPLLNLVLEYVSPPVVELDKPFAMLVTLLDSDPFLGRCLVGRVEQGSVDVNANVQAVNLDGIVIEKRRLFFLQNILRNFVDICSQKRGEVKARLVAAKQLNDDEVNKIKNELSKDFTNKVKLDYKYDPSLIGGLIIQVGSVMIDTSIKSKLKQLENKMIGT